MNKISDWNELIKSIPIIIRFIVPGYIFLSVKNFYSESEKQKDDNILLKSLIISSVISTIANIFISENNYFYHAILIVLAIVLSILYVKFIYCGYIEKIAHRFKLYKTFKKDTFDYIIDTELGMWFYIYLEDEKIIYIGKVIYYENAIGNNHRYIQLSNYSCYSYDGKKISDYEDDNYKTVLLNTKDIKRIELFYNPSSKKIKSS